MKESASSLITPRAGDLDSAGCVHDVLAAEASAAEMTANEGASADDGLSIRKDWRCCLGDGIRRVPVTSGDDDAVGSRGHATARGKERPLANQHILVPASRAGRNVLADLLAKKGAKVTTFPAVEVAAPDDEGPLRAAATKLSTFDWVLVAGRDSAQRFQRVLAEGAREPDAGLRASVCAIGAGAASELRTLGWSVSTAPREHIPGGIAEALGEIDGKSILLVREQSAGDALPQHLRSQGAQVVCVAAYAAKIVATQAQARRAFRYRPDLLALASPTAVRYFVCAATDNGLDVRRCLGGVTVAAVGLETAAEAKRNGLQPDLVSCGRLSALVRDLICLYGRQR